MEPFCFINGEYLPVSTASVNVYDIGLLRGYGVYEGIKIYGTKPFRLQDHLDRFRRSAADFDLGIAYIDKEITAAIDSLVQRNSSLTNSAGGSQIRILLTGGNTIDGIEFDPSKTTFYILHEQTKPLAPEIYTKGAKLITYQHQRAYPNTKTINYLTAVKVQKQRKAAGALEVLFVSNGKILECATSNFFLWKGDTLITPSTQNILSGITRKVALELAGTMPGIKIEEREVALSELADATGAFISASFKEIVPIVEIAGEKIADGKVDANTAKLIELFRKCTLS